MYTPILLAAPVGGSTVAATGASATTSIIVGVAVDSGSNERGCYWDSLGIHLLVNLAGGSSGAASGCSYDALYIVGGAVDSGSVLRAVVWTRGTTVTIAALPDLGFGGSAQAISYDDSTIVGYVVDSSGFHHACAWNAGPSWELTALVGFSGNNCEAHAVSIDGSTIVGVGQITGGDDHGVKWTGGPVWADGTDLGLASGGISAIVYGCSGNASTIVGSGLVSFAPAALIWTADGAGTLTPPPGASSDSFARGVDLSGTYIGGYSLISAELQPVLWTSGVPAVLGLPEGIVGASVLGIGPDAATLYGTTTSPVEVAIAWVGPPPAAPQSQFLVCGNNWSIAQPLVQVYGLDHLVGQSVVGLADGVPVGPLTVQSDGSVLLPFPASYVTLGLGFTVQLQTPYLDVGNPTVQGRRKDFTAATIRVDASAAPLVGSNQPDGGSFTPTQVGPTWSNMQPSVTQDPQQFPGTYVNPSGQKVTLLFSGDFRANLQPGWDERGQIAVQQTLPLPLSVTAAIPEALLGDLAEQTISMPQGQGQQGPGPWMLTSRTRR